MDVLTDVLETVRVVAACYGRLEATAPWGIRVRPGEDAKFHVVLEGHARLVVEGVAEPIELSAGDIVALPHGHAHSLVDDPGVTLTPSLLADPSVTAQPLEELLVCRPRGDNSVLRVGGGGQSSTIVSGRFRFEDRRNNPLLSVLPPVITLRGEMGKSVRWLEPTLKFIACEAQSGRPGSQTVIARLADVLFIQIVRGHLASLPVDGSGWLGALADAQIGAALGHIPSEPRAGLDSAIFGFESRHVALCLCVALHAPRRRTAAVLRNALADAKGRQHAAGWQTDLGGGRSRCRLRFGGSVQQSLQASGRLGPRRVSPLAPRSKSRSGRVTALQPDEAIFFWPLGAEAQTGRTARR